MNRFVLGWQPLWKIWTEPEFADRAEGLLRKAPSGPDLRVLAVLQRDGRLVDFLQEDIDPYSDAQVGAAVRDIHRGCRKALRDYLTVSPILPRRRGVGGHHRPGLRPGLDPPDRQRPGLAAVPGGPQASRLAGRGGPPARPPGARDDSSVLAPAEVEIP